MISQTKPSNTAFIIALYRSVAHKEFQNKGWGSGYDTRGLRFKHLIKNTRIIELDMAATQNRKIKCLKKNKINIPDYLTLSPVDFNRQSLENALTSADYKADRQTLFIWEGVSMYLEAQAVKDTLSFIARSSHTDSLLAFDSAISNADQDYYGTKELLKHIKKNRSNEPFKFFVEEEKIENFLNKQGFKIISHFDSKQIEKTYLKKEDGSSIGKPNGMFCLAIALCGLDSNFDY